MQFTHKDFDPKSAKQLQNAPDPDDFLTQKYSQILDADREQFELCKMYLYHLDLKKQIHLVKDEIGLLKERLRHQSTVLTPKKHSRDLQKTVKQEQNSHSNQQTNRLKRIRRTANQISRHFQCPVETCNKEYGSEGSLNQHIKLKHEYLVKNYESWMFEPKKQLQSEQ